MDFSMDRKGNSIVLKDVRICSKNFSGREGQYNPAGRRNFSVKLPIDAALVLKEEGWNVSIKEPDEEYDGVGFLPVHVKFDNFPPDIYMINSKRRMKLNESNIGMLDGLMLERVDLIIRPYHWNVAGKSGIKAYVSKLNAKIQEDDLDNMYSDIPLIGDDGEIPFN